MSKRTLAILQLTATGILWSISGVFIKLIDLHPFAISCMRSAFAALVMLSFLRFKPRFSFSKSQLIGALCCVGTVSMFVVANKHTTAANAILLQYGAPIYVAFLAYVFLKERLHWFDFVAIGGVAVGMVTFFADSISAGGMLGNLLAVSSGVTFAGQAVCLRLEKDSGATSTILLGNIFAVLIGLPFVFVTPPAPTDLLYLFILGVFQLGIPYILYSLAAKNATALDMIVIPMLEPILSPVWVFLAVGERPGLFALIGGAIVVSTVAFKSYFSLRAESAVADEQPPVS